MLIVVHYHSLTESYFSYVLRIGSASYGGFYLDLIANTCFDCNKNALKERQRPEINLIYHQINLFVFVKYVFIESNMGRGKNDKTQTFLWPVQTTGARNKGAV